MSTIDRAAGLDDADEIPALIRAAEGTYAHDYSSEGRLTW